MHRPRPRTAPRALRLGAVLSVLAACGGCLGDPGSPPEVAPIEVVARDTGEPACLLNRADVAAGVHQTFLLAEGGPATIRLLDPDGAVILESAVADGDGATSNPELVEGDHVVECRWPDGERRTVQLTVVPGRL